MDNREYQDPLLRALMAKEIWMEPGVTTQTLSQTQALAYREKQHAGKVNLVLGAGNVSCIGPLDILYKMFVEDQVVLLKMNPVNAYVGPFIAESLQALIQRNFLRIVYGGTTEGAYLCNHPGIDEIHITGSDKTFEAIVFGTGEQGATRKAQRKPQLEKRVTGELGNVSPVILVPGPWTPDEIAYHAEHLVTTLIVNAGFNCNATRVILQHASWDQREPFLQAMRKILTQLPLRDAYYPGAHERHQHFLASHPKAEQFGHPQEKQLPWTLITGLDPTRADDPCFTTEAFCSLFSETALVAENVVEYIKQAVSFCNERLWGTLNATILVHPQSLKVPEVAAAIERAVANLRYGTIGVNCWAGSGFLLGTTTWGAFPGHTIYDVQSGIGVVRNTLMFSRPQKSVLRGTFRNVPTPAWFATHGKIATRVVPKLADFEAAPSFWKVLALIWTAMKG
ncbi:MAG: aldehyde dehydrogenase family protein [Chloroflexi bacterium]|nr:MAG: aldehyde dehydrogenase family protein [Chloroflexota bacterium]